MEALPVSTEQPGSTGPGIAVVSSWLSSDGLETDGELTIRRLGMGCSNLMFVVDDGHQRWALRRLLFGQRLASAHDVVREARIMDALRGTDVPVPRIYGVHSTDDGVPCVLMEYVAGFVVDHTEVAERLEPQLAGALALALPRALGSIHELDLDSVGLSDLASHAPYAQRQLKRWTGQWEATKTRDIPDVDELAARLVAATPPQVEVSLVHGDLHIANVISEDGRITAVLDWELSTLGDRLADVGTLLAYWPHGDETGGRAIWSPSQLASFPECDELVEAYADSTGRDVSTIVFWHVLGLWKVAIIAEGIRRRVQDDPRNSADEDALSASDIEALVDYTRQMAADAGI